MDKTGNSADKYPLFTRKYLEGKHALCENKHTIEQILRLTKRSPTIFHSFWFSSMSMDTSVLSNQAITDYYLAVLKSVIAWLLRSLCVHTHVVTDCRKFKNVNYRLQSLRKPQNLFDRMKNCINKRVELLSALL